MKERSLLLVLAALCSLLTAVNPARAQGTAFTYQGQLQDTGGPANGTYNFTFTLYTNSSGGTPVAGPVGTNGVMVTNGLFTVQIDFGASQWNGQTNWLEIAVETNTANTLTTLAPRQQVTPTPYAIFATTASNLSGILPAAQLPPGVVTNNETGVTITGTFTGNGGGLTNVPADWQTVSGTSQTAAANYAYLLTNNSLSTVTLPAAPDVGDIVTVSGSGSNGWQVVPNGGQIIAGSYSGAGITWTAQNSAPAAIWISVASSSDGTKLVAACDSGQIGNTPVAGQIYTSSDSGVTWTVQAGAPTANWGAVASSSDGTKLVAIVQDANAGQIYTSSDSGVTWTAQNGAPTGQWNCVASSADGTKLAAAIYPGTIYTSSDSGVTWTAQNNAPAVFIDSIASSADGTKLAATASGGLIYTSGDSGVTWTAQNGAPSAVWYGIASSSDGTKLVALGFGPGDAGGPIYTSSDSGVTWTAQNSGSQPWYSVASSSDGTKLVAGGLDTLISTSGNSGVTWTQQNSSTQFWTSIASSSDGNKLVAVAQAGQIYTSDATNFFSGGPGTKAQFQYVGNGVWLPLSQVAGPISLAQLPAGVVTNNEAGVNISGTFTGNGAGISNVDLLNVNGDGAINWTTNTPWGNFMLSSTPATGNLPVSVAAADVNGDGYIDLISVNENDRTVTVLTNDGTGHFKTSSTVLVDNNQNSQPLFVTTADVNGDGYPDVITANFNDDTLTVLTNNGTGGFVLSSMPIVAYFPQSVVAADVNGDGHVDLISASRFEESLTILTNDGRGNFVLSSTLPVNDGATSVTAADVNGDGHVDLICADSSGGTLMVFTNNGTGGFVLSSTLTATSQPGSSLSCVTAADVNGDGHVDLICVDQNLNTLTVFLNNGTGGFTLSSTVPVGSGPRSVTAADVNGDGHVDLICANFNDGTLTVLTNNGSGGFTRSSTLTTGGEPNSVVAADVNNDGHPDLISADYAPMLSVFFNTDAPTYTAFFIGNGAGLTGLNFLQLNGTLQPNQLPTNVVTTSETNVILASLAVTNLTVAGTNEIAPLTVPPVVPTAAIGSASTGSTPVSIAVAGRYAYVVNEASQTLQVFDVSNPANPMNVGTATGLSNPQAVAVGGRYAYVSGGNLQIFDVSDAANPVSVGTSSGVGGDSIAVSGHYAYTTGGSGMAVVDVSNPANPVVAGSAATENGAACIAVAGRYAYIGAGIDYLQIVDINIPTNPVVVSTVTTYSADPGAIAVSGRYAYMACEAETQIFDVSNPANPLRIGSLNNNGGLGNSIAVAGRFAYSVSDSDNALQVFDVSNPASPVNVGFVGTGQEPISLAVSGRYAYVVNRTAGNLQIFDLGGAYIQPLEAGTIEAGTLQTRDKARVGQDLNVGGGLTVGGSAHFTGGLSANDITGGLTTNIVVTVPTGTKTLYFTNGVLRAAQ